MNYKLVHLPSYSQHTLSFNCSSSAWDFTSDPTWPTKTWSCLPDDHLQLSGYSQIAPLLLQFAHPICSLLYTLHNPYKPVMTSIEVGPRPISPGMCRSEHFSFVHYPASPSILADMPHTSHKDSGKRSQYILAWLVLNFYVGKMSLNSNI
jgi:hypothetical protein